jgi:hypothetical protein
MSIVVVKPGALVELDPNDIRTVAVDWDDENLRDGVAIDTSTFTITTIKQNGATILTKDNPAILTAAQATIALERTVTGEDRVTRIRLDATTATAGDQYQVDNKVVTDESPTQTKDKHFLVSIRNQ